MHGVSVGDWSVSPKVFFDVTSQHVPFVPHPGITCGSGSPNTQTLVVIIVCCLSRRQQRSDRSVSACFTVTVMIVLRVLTCLTLVSLSGKRKVLQRKRSRSHLGTCCDWVWLTEQQESGCDCVLSCLSSRSFSCFCMQAVRH